MKTRQGRNGWCIAGVLLALVATGVAAENLAPNSSFEDPPAEGSSFPPHWEQFSSGQENIMLVSYDKRTGHRCILMKAQKDPNSFKGILFKRPVVAGERYDFSAWIKNNHRDSMGGTTEGLLVIEWKDAMGEEISRNVSPKWDQTMPRLRWTRVFLKEMVAPEGAETALFGIHLVEDHLGGRGSYLVDDVELVLRSR